MLTYPEIDPVIFSIFDLKIRWYGMMYVVGFLVGWWLARRRSRQAWWQFTTQQIDDLIFYVMLGVILGGRLGYTLFYGWANIAADPLYIFKIWEGGMSFHGGFLGVVIAMMWFARSHGKKWLQVTDFIAPLCPLGLGAGRIGNFINAELWGRPSDVPWAMVFPQVDGLARHPSQLYEFLLEGLVLFALVWFYSRRWRPLGAVSGVFLLGYGVLRFIVEFTREPDSFLGLLPLELSMGQWLSLPMIVAGLILIIWANRHGRRPRPR